MSSDIRHYFSSQSKLATSATSSETATATAEFELLCDDAKPARSPFAEEVTTTLFWYSSSPRVASVVAKLKAAGVYDDDKYEDRCSRCAIVAVSKGYLKFDGSVEDLDRPARGPNGPWEFKDCTGCGCDHILRPTLRDLMKQPDYAGVDYVDLKEATVRCKESDCPGAAYVTRMCQGDFDEDSGRSHNHCLQCPHGGTCINDYRNIHCEFCGSHYFLGSTFGGFPCHTCGKRYGDTYSDDDEDEEKCETGTKGSNKRKAHFLREFFDDFSD
jgi:hypothetical protein